MVAAIIAIALGLFGAWVYQNYGGSGIVSAVIGELNANQIAQYAQTAGFSGDDLVTAVAIALAESSGNPSAHNEGTADVPEDSRGLWQINVLANPEFSSDNLYDPQTNANDAYEIYNQSGFSPWSTFTSGAYSAYLSTAQIGVQELSA